MSDDEFLGKSCFCVPRRLFVLLFASALLVYSSTYFLYLFIFKWIAHDVQLTPIHCSGQECREVVTCMGMTEATYHVRMVAIVLGGMVMGYQGVTGAAQSHATELSWFGFLCIAEVVVILSTCVGDVVFEQVCDAYSYNVISEALLWPWPLDNFMIEERIVFILEQMKFYPVDTVEALIGQKKNIWLFYSLLTFFKVALFSYVAREALQLAEHVAFGIFGLGANFGFMNWRDNVIFKRDVEDFGHYQKDRAVEGLQDIRDMVTNSEIHGIRRTPVPYGFRNNQYGSAQDGGMF